MKKFLSLVMALVMTMSLVTISAGAKDFTDAADVSYNEAIDVMSAMKVVDGYPDGSFKPNAQLNRGQAAKILCNMILGPTTASALKADSAPFKDVPADSTFAGYIAYCSQAGIIDGYTDGTFRPAAPLTGYAFMKLLLGALGYDKGIEGYNVPNWSINVAKRALNIGLDKGLADDFNGTKIVTRQEACLYAFNTLKATMVKYDNNSTITVGDIVISANSKAEPETWADSNGYNYKGTKSSKDETVQFCEKYFPKLKLDDDARDAYGRPANKWSKSNDEIGTYPATADVVYTANTKMYQVTRDLDFGTSDAANFYYTLNATKTQENVDSKTSKPLHVAYHQSNSTIKLSDQDTIGAYVGNGVTVEIFYEDEPVNANNKIVVIDEYIGEVKEVKTDDDGRYVTLKNEPSTRRFYTEDFAKGDMVLFTIGSSTTKFASMKAAEKLTGKLETLTSGGKYTIDGTTYELHGGKAAGTGIDSNAKPGDTVDFYLDSNGYIIKLDVAEASSVVENLVLISEAKDIDWDVKAKVIYGSGKTATEVIKTSGAAADIQQYYIYSASTSSGKVKLSVLNDHTYFYGADTTAEQGYYFTKGSTKITDADSSQNYVQVNAKTVFVYVDEGNNTVKTYTGHSNAPTVKGANRFVALKQKDAAAAKLVYIYVDNATVSTKVTDLLYAVVNDYKLIRTTNANGDAMEYYDVSTVTGETIKVHHDVYNETEFNNYKNAGVVVYSSVTTDENGIITGVDKKADSNLAYKTTDSVVEENAGVLYFDTVGQGYSDKVVVYEIDAEYNVTVVDVTDIDDTYAGYTYVKNDDGLITTVVLKCK